MQGYSDLSQASLSVCPSRTRKEELIPLITYSLWTFVFLCFIKYKIYIYYIL